MENLHLPYSAFPILSNSTVNEKWVNVDKRKNCDYGKTIFLHKRSMDHRTFM